MLQSQLVSMFRLYSTLFSFYREKTISKISPHTHMQYEMLCLMYTIVNAMDEQTGCALFCNFFCPPRGDQSTAQSLTSVFAFLLEDWSYPFSIFLLHLGIPNGRLVYLGCEVKYLPRQI